MLADGDIPCVRGTAIFGLKAAAESLWGDHGMADIAYRLPADARRALMDELVMPQAWIPEKHLIAFCRAAWEGPSHEEVAPYYAFLGQSAFHGFGRFQKIILGLASPHAIAARVPALWRRDHTHGELEAEASKNGCVMRLRDHPYVETEFARDLISQTFRQVMTLTRVGAKDVRVRHSLDARAGLLVHLSW